MVPARVVVCSPTGSVSLLDIRVAASMVRTKSRSRVDGSPEADRGAAGIKERSERSTHTTFQLPRFFSVLGTSLKMVKQTVISTDAAPCLPVFGECAFAHRDLEVKMLKSGPLTCKAHSCISDGKVYVSGTIGCNKEFKIVSGGIKAQTVCHPSNQLCSACLSDLSSWAYSQRMALEHIRVVLRDSGSALEHIVKVNIYMANLPRDFDDMNEAYLEVSEHVVDIDLY